MLQVTVIDAPKTFELCLVPGWCQVWTLTVILDSVEVWLWTKPLIDHASVHLFSQTGCELMVPLYNFTQSLVYFISKAKPCWTFPATRMLLFKWGHLCNNVQTLLESTCLFGEWLSMFSSGFVCVFRGSSWRQCQCCASNHEADIDQARSLSGFGSFSSQGICGIVVSDTLIVMGLPGCK